MTTQGSISALQVGTAPLQGLGFGIGYGLGVRIGYEVAYPRLRNGTINSEDYILRMIPGYSAGVDRMTGSINQMDETHNPAQGQVAPNSNSGGYTSQIINSQGAKYISAPNSKSKVLKLTENL